MEQNRNISELRNAANDMLEQVQGLKQIAASGDGASVKRLMEQDAGRLKEAMQKGDIAALKQTFDRLMGTEEGARLIGKIKEQITENR